MIFPDLLGEGKFGKVKEHIRCVSRTALPMFLDNILHCKSGLGSGTPKRKKPDPFGPGFLPSPFDETL